MTRHRSLKRLVDDQDRAPGEQARVAGMQARVGLTFDLARHVFGQHEQHRRGHLAGHLSKATSGASSGTVVLRSSR